MFSTAKGGIAAGLGGIGSGLASLFGGSTNPADAAMGYLNGIPSQLQQYMAPFINNGMQAGNMLQGQYGNLLSNPGGMLNAIGANYHQSPGYQFALQQALQGAGHAAAAGGMAGSPQHEQQNMGLATNLANQDYYNWLGGATGLYNSGLSGAQNMYGIGAQMGGMMGEDLSQAAMNQALLSYMGQAAQNQARGSAFGNIAGGIGTLFGYKS